tara:strand:- start:242 stop:430 length:189 start_codon:yes stop_codon:yes gene_type:complete
MTNQETHTELIYKYRELTDPMSNLYKTWNPKALSALESAIGCVLATEVRDTEERMLPRKGGV